MEKFPEEALAAAKYAVENAKEIYNDAAFIESPLETAHLAALIAFVEGLRKEVTSWADELEGFEYANPDEARLRSHKAVASVSIRMCANYLREKADALPAAPEGGK